VAVEAVVDLFEDFARVVAPVCELEAVAPSQVLVEPAHQLGQSRVGPFELNQVLVVERVREAETDPSLHALARVRTQRVRRRPSLDQLQRRTHERTILVSTVFDSYALILNPPSGER